MPADEVDRVRMTQLVLQAQDAEEKRQQASEALELWVRRGKLALGAGRRELAAQAKAKALEAKEALLGAEADLDRIHWARRALRREARRPGDRPTFDAEMLVEDFRLKGFAPEEQESSEVAARMEAELALRELRGDPVETMPSEVPSDTPTAPTPSAGPGSSEPTSVDAGALERELAALKTVCAAEESTEVDFDALAALERDLAAPGPHPDDELQPPDTRPEPVDDELGDPTLHPAARDSDQPDS